MVRLMGYLSEDQKQAELDEIKKALDDLVKKGKLRKFWSNDRQDFMYIDSKAPLSEEEKRYDRRKPPKSTTQNNL
jgi:hypothetical protein